MERLIALQNNLGLGHLGDVIITTQGRMDENKPCIATLSGDEVGAAMSLIERCNEHDTLKAKEALFDEAIDLFNFAHLCVSYARIEECDKNCTDDNCDFCRVSNALVALLSKAKELK